MKIKCTFKNYEELIAFAKDILQKEADSDKASQEQPNYIPLSKDIPQKEADSDKASQEQPNYIPLSSCSTAEKQSERTERIS